MGAGKAVGWASKPLATFFSNIDEPALNP